MKRILVSVFPLFLVISLTWSTESLGAPGELQGRKDKISYSLGYQIGGDMNKEGRTVDPDALLKGIEDAMVQAEPEINQQEMRAILVKLKKSVVRRQQAEKQEMMEQRFGEGDKFLAENAAKDGIIVLPSGLQYKILREGKGRTPGPEDRVSIKYKSSMIDGTLFHNSLDDDEPETFYVKGVIRGMTEALLLMKEGARWEIFVPADLAYGQRGMLANRTVIFDLELISIESTN